MKSVSAKTYARAGLLGNPSDGYNGKTISLIIGDYFAEVTFTHAETISILPAENETREFRSLKSLQESVTQQGYYGSERLIKAALKRFADFAGEKIPSRHENFTVSVASSIPRQVGLAGSSAIVMATLRAAMKWFNIEIAPQVLASLTLSIEKDDLKIPAGLQDRVIQAFEGVMFMDFSKASMHDEHGFDVGHYEPLDLTLLPEVYVAYSRLGGEPTEITHTDIRGRFHAGDQIMVKAMESFAELAEQGKQALIAGDHERVHDLINANFDLRRSICNLHPLHIQMIETARSVGASAKFCGSGGAIIGTCTGPDNFTKLKEKLAQIDCETLRPTIGHFQ
ncbi:MAG: hypothetical protein R3C03_18385 [Pirellulaceae bacterium]